MANNALSALIDFYEVDDSATVVKLIVTIGFRQNSVSSVRLNETKIVPPAGKGNQFGDFIRSFSTDLGANTALVDKDLMLETIVHDINDVDNRTSITIKLEGGVKEREPWKLGPISVVDGGIIKYSARIGFFKKSTP